MAEVILILSFLGHHGYQGHHGLRGSPDFVAVATIAILAIMAIRADTASLFVEVCMIDLCVVLLQNRVEACLKFDACLSFVVP